MENHTAKPCKIGICGKKFLSFPQCGLWRMWKTQPFFFRTFGAKTPFSTKKLFFRAMANCPFFSWLNRVYFVRTLVTKVKILPTDCRVFSARGAFPWGRGSLSSLCRFYRGVLPLLGCARHPHRIRAQASTVFFLHLRRL